MIFKKKCFTFSIWQILFLLELYFCTKCSTFFTWNTVKVWMNNCALNLSVVHTNLYFVFFLLFCSLPHSPFLSLLIFCHPKITIKKKKKKKGRAKLLSSEWIDVKIAKFLIFKQMLNLSELQLCVLHSVNCHKKPSPSSISYPLF